MRPPARERVSRAAAEGRRAECVCEAESELESVSVRLVFGRRLHCVLTLRCVGVGRSGPNLEPGTMRVYVTNGPPNGLNIDRMVGPCPGSRRWWVLGSVCASF